MIASAPPNVITLCIWLTLSHSAVSASPTDHSNADVFLSDDLLFDDSGLALPPSYPAERQRVDQRQYPWRSIGSLSIAGRQFCTATLISETQVITAAHCLWNSETSDWYPTEFIHFLAGYQQGEYLGHSLVQSIEPSPAFRFSSPPTLTSLVHDWARVTLQRPLGKALGFIPLRTAPTASAQSLQLAGYRQDRPEALSVAKSCHQDTEQTNETLRGFLIHSCAALSGDSGGPLLSGAGGTSVNKGEEIVIEAIHVGRQHSNLTEISLSLPAYRFTTAGSQN